MRKGIAGLMLIKAKERAFHPYGYEIKLSYMLIYWNNKKSELSREFPSRLFKIIA